MRTDRPFLLVTGAPAAGKSTLVGELAGTIDRALVFDTDLFGESSHPAWEAWATNWLLLAEAANDNGLLPVPVGYGLHRSSIETLPARTLLGPNRCLYLDVPESTIRARLATRGGFAEERLDRKFRHAAELKADADDAQLESVRRAIRSLNERGLVERKRRWDSRPRKSLKRFVALAPCEEGFCDLCGQRKRRVRLRDWHRRVMRENAKHDPAWLDDLALAEKSGFLHETASPERLVDENPNTVDQCQRRLQFVSPVANRPGD